MVCSDPLQRVFGIQARRTGVVIFTAPGPYSALNASLASISPLQQSHFEKHHAFATSLSELGWSDPSGLISVELTRAQDGASWYATGKHRYLTSMLRSVSGERKGD